MKEWKNAEVQELNVTETANGWFQNQEEKRVVVFGVETWSHGYGADDTQSNDDDTNTNAKS